MRCGKCFRIVQKTNKRTILDNNDMGIGEETVLTEIQDLGECYKENCGYWDKTLNRCIG